MMGEEKKNKFEDGVCERSPEHRDYTTEDHPAVVV